MKRLLLGAVALIGAAVWTGGAEAAEKASLRLNWLIYGFDAPFYLGVASGTYTKHGIDLTIGEGQGSGRTVQIVAAGSDTFGLADGSSIISGVAKEVPVRAVMGVMNQSPYAIIVRKDSGIASIKELAGKTIAATTGEAGLLILPAVLKAAGLADDAVSTLRVDGASKLVAVLEKHAVGMLGGVENQALILESRGLPVTSLMYADVGLNTQGLAIVAGEDTIKSNPDLVRRFIAATREAYEAGEKNPEAAIQAAMAARPQMDHDLSLAQLNAGLKLLRSPHGPKQPLGWMSAEDWTETLRLMKQYQDLKTDLPAETFWTNAYLPQ
jgi:NitT/TauT family transport system substrate-binding protein